MTFVAGQKTRASELNEVVAVMGYVTSDQTKTSSTALADVTGLSVALEANRLYALDGYIAYNAGATGDLKMAITVPSGTTGHWALYPIAVASTGSIGDLDARRQDAFGDANTQSAGGSDAAFGSTLLCLPRAYLDTSGTAGTLQFRYAQNTSNGTSTIIKTGSWIRLTRLDV
jgi:hypothetical protein